MDTRDIVNFLLIYDSIDFSFWGESKCIFNLFNNCDSRLVYKEIENMSLEQFKEILKGNVDIPLLEERYRIITGTARIVNEKMNGSFYGYMRRMNTDKEIFETIVNTFKRRIGEYMYNNYYKAYEKRYKQVHKENMLWAPILNTPDVIKFIMDYKITKKDRMLDLGCGEGRDAIYLLDKGYNVLAIDYSKSAINICNKLSNNKYIKSFRSLDILEDILDEKFKYIYSIAVLHMFVLDEHRNKYFSFIRSHLEDDGRCLLCVIGNGKQNYKSDIKEAFTNTERTIMNNNTKINVATTSCKIVDWRGIK